MQKFFLQLMSSLQNPIQVNGWTLVEVEVNAPLNHMMLQIANSDTRFEVRRNPATGVIRIYEYYEYDEEYEEEPFVTVDEIKAINYLVAKLIGAYTE